MSDIQTINGAQSPFDVIRRERPDGTEFWSARDLADAMTYDQWRNFAAAIDRARVTLGNQGHEAEDHIAGASKMVQLGSGSQRAVDDYHLTRFGAYLVVMNGDPRKPEVAAAQAYFAVQTRVAETRPELTDAEIVHRALTITTRQVEALKVENRTLVAAIERDAPLVAKAEAHTGSDGDVHRQEFSREVQQWGMKQGIDIKQAEVMRFLGHIGLFIRGDRSDTGHATADATRRGLAFTHKGTAKNDHAYATGKLTPAGQDYAWKMITRYVANNGSLSLPRELRGGEAS